MPTTKQNMPRSRERLIRTVTTSEAKAKLSALLAGVREHRDAVIVEKRGVPSAVLLSYAEYEQVLLFKEQQRRQEAAATLRRLRDEVRARNQDLTDEGAEVIAAQFSRDVLQGLIDKGQVHFQP